MIEPSGVAGRHPSAGSSEAARERKGSGGTLFVVRQAGICTGRATTGAILRAGLVAMTAGGARLMRYQLGSRRNLSGRCNRKAAVWRDAEDLDKQSGGT